MNAVNEAAFFAAATAALAAVGRTGLAVAFAAVAAIKGPRDTLD
jgi:hypothetical protein